MYIDEISLHSQPARQELSQLGDPQRIGLPLRRLRRWGFERPEDVAGPTTISLGMIVFYVERSMNRFFLFSEKCGKSSRHDPTDAKIMVYNVV